MDRARAKMTVWVPIYSSKGEKYELFEVLIPLHFLVSFRNTVVAMNVLVAIAILPVAQDNFITIL